MHAAREVSTTPGARGRLPCTRHCVRWTSIRKLRDPVFLAAFVGFTDTTGGAAAAITYLIEQWDAKPLAEIDPEQFYDFTVQRPRVRLENGERVLDWPVNRFFVASPPGAGRDFVLLQGIEPHTRWKTFTGVRRRHRRDC